MPCLCRRRAGENGKHFSLQATGRRSCLLLYDLWGRAGGGDSWKIFISRRWEKNIKCQLKIKIICTIDGAIDRVQTNGEFIFQYLRQLDTQSHAFNNNRKQYKSIYNNKWRIKQSPLVKAHNAITLMQKPINCENAYFTSGV